jgi:iron complex transport system substrate-binding protein
VFTFNQRSVPEILQMIAVLGGIVGVPERAAALVRDLEAGLDAIRAEAARWRRRPRVYFEEWPDPLISGICWVEELIEIAGGDPVFPSLRRARLAKDRIVTSEQVVEAQPDVIIGSWCGKPVRKEKIAARPGWDRIPAVRHGHIYEVKSTYILQPGPASLTDGVRQIHRILKGWAESPPQT